MEEFDKKTYINYVKMKMFVNKLHQNCFDYCLEENGSELNNNEKKCLENCEQNIKIFMKKAERNFDETINLFSNLSKKLKEEKMMHTI